MLAQLLLVEHRMPCRHATFCLSGDFNIDHKMTAAAVEAKDKDEEKDNEMDNEKEKYKGSDSD